MEKTAAGTAHQEEVRDLNSEEGKEMDILKDLPSYNSSNFSRLLPQSSSSNGFTTGRSISTAPHRVKSYIRLKSKSDSHQPQVIVMESESLILRELEALLAQQQAATRISLKRSSSCAAAEHDSQSSSSSCKIPRTDTTDDDDSWSIDS